MFLSFSNFSLPGEAFITFAGALVIGIVCTAMNRLAVSLMLTTILAILVEALIVNTKMFAKFGETLVNHMLPALVMVIIIHLVGRLVANLFQTARHGDSATAVTATEARSTLKVATAHWLGLLNFVPALAPLAIGAYYLISRKGDEAVLEEIAEALHFQTMAAGLFLLCALLKGHAAGIIILPVLIAWIALTVIGGIQATRKGTYRYPINVRFLQYFRPRQVAES
jgi:hypothetical protein